MSVNLLQLRIRTENELNALFGQHHEFKRRSYPEWASYDGDHRYDDQLTDLSHDAATERYQKNRTFLRQLKALSIELLSEEDQRNARLFQRVLEEDINFYTLGLHLLCVDQQEGMHLKFPQWAEVHPLKTHAQYQQYFSRLKAFRKQVEDTLHNLKLGIKRGLVHPACVVKQSLLQIQELAEAQLLDMPLFQPILSHAHHLSDDLAKRVKAVAQRLIQEEVQPAYQLLYDFLKNTYLPVCPEKVGLCHLKSGGEIYQYWIDRHVKKGADFETIHKLGKQEISRLKKALSPILKALNLSYKPQSVSDWAALRRNLAKNPAYYYQDAELLLKDYQDMLNRAKRLLPRLFDVLPQSDCVLKPLEPWRAAAAPQAYYYTPPQDLSRPGIYYVNTHALHERPSYAMMALTLHEAVPGHHLQLARALESSQLPDFRYHLECTAFVEGWALYAESLGFEMGLYDSVQTLGALAFELWRASRLVVDSGLHGLGWTRKQACDYLKNNTLQSETDIQSEVDRYIALPAQALAYKMGERQITAWRTEAEERYQSTFDLKAFHEVLLQSGSLPLEELDLDVQAYLNRAASLTSAT